MVATLELLVVIFINILVLTCIHDSLLSVLKCKIFVTVLSSLSSLILNGHILLLSGIWIDISRSPLIYARWSWVTIGETLLPDALSHRKPIDTSLTGWFYGRRSCGTSGLHAEQSVSISDSRISAAAAATKSLLMCSGATRPTGGKLGAGLERGASLQGSIFETSCLSVFD